MIKIVNVIKPFDFTQKIYVFKDGEQIDSVICNTKTLAETIYSLTQKYEISQIDLAGAPKDYSKHIGDTILTYITTKYDGKDIIINYI